jgi:hypothetical protein
VGEAWHFPSFESQIQNMRAKYSKENAFAQEAGQGDMSHFITGQESCGPGKQWATKTLDHKSAKRQRITPS